VSGVTSVTIFPGNTFAIVQLRNIRIRNPFLVIVDIEDRRAIRSAYVISLPVELRTSTELFNNPLWLVQAYELGDGW
jgi:hypothetical protein